MSVDEKRTVRLVPAAYERLQRITASVNSAGWKALGSNRTVAATYAAVVDYALEVLEKDIQSRLKKKH